MEKRGTTETSCIARASNLEVLGMDLCTSILGITIPNPDEMELPEFVQSIPTSVGDEIATDGTQNIRLPFCILLVERYSLAPLANRHILQTKPRSNSAAGGSVAPRTTGYGIPVPSDAGRLSRRVEPLASAIEPSASMARA